MAPIVYILCAFTSFTCVFLLMRAYRRNKSRLLFWCSLGFTGLALNNTFLFFDLAVFVDSELTAFRTMPAFLGMIIMVYGLIMEEV